MTDPSSFSCSVLESVPVDDDAAAPVALIDENNTSDEHGQDEESLNIVASAETEVTSNPTPAAVNVDSECDSDDEWNYVKPKEDQEKDNLPETDQQEIQSEPELGQEQHAEVHAIAESQEHCSEVSGRGFI